jgi:PTS system fructose-specific IIC component/fructose-specific PTS system IIC-like component
MEFWKETKEVFKETGLHFRTGVSYMLPVILIGGMLGSLAVFGGPVIEDDSIWKIFKDLGEIGLKYFVPIMAAYTAYSISDTPGIAPGFIVGILAQQIGTGYLGALLGGILVGYVTYMLLKVELTQILQSTWGFLAPVISTLIVSIFLVYVIGAPIAALMNFLSEFLSSLNEGGTSTMGAVMGFLGGIDYGGPFSKTQSTFATAVMDIDLFIPLGICGAIVTVPPLGLCLATFLRPKLYTKTEREYAKKSWIYAIIGGFTEIVIPLAVGDLLRVTIATAIGTTVAGFIAGYFLLELSTPVLGIAQWFFYNKPMVFVLCVVVGSVTTALIVNFLKGISDRDIAAIEAAEAEED